MQDLTLGPIETQTVCLDPLIQSRFLGSALLPSGR